MRGELRMLTLVIYTYPSYRDFREPCKTVIGVCTAMRLALKLCQKCFRTFLFLTIRHLISLL